MDKIFLVKEEFVLIQELIDGLKEISVKFLKVLIEKNLRNKNVTINNLKVRSFL